MINNTHTINIDGKILENDEIAKAFTFNTDDKFSLWVLRPLTLLAAIGMGVTVLFASAFIIMISLAMLPVLAISLWALKTKLDRDLARENPVVDTQTSHNVASDDNTQTAS